MAAAEALFASRGFAKTSMAQIAEQAGVAVGSVYRAFPDKLSLLSALHEAMEHSFIDVLVASWDIDAPPALRFRTMIDALMRQASSVRSSMPLYMLTRDLVSSGGEEPGKRTISVIAKLYDEGVRRGDFIPVSASVAAAIAHGMVEGAMQDWMAREARAADLPEIVDILASCFERAFVAPQSDPHSAATWIQ